MKEVQTWITQLIICHALIRKLLIYLFIYFLFSDTIDND